MVSHKAIRAWFLEEIKWLKPHEHQACVKYMNDGLDGAPDPMSKEAWRLFYEGAREVNGGCFLTWSTTADVEAAWVAAGSPDVAPKPDAGTPEPAPEPAAVTPEPAADKKSGMGFAFIIVGLVILVTMGIFIVTWAPWATTEQPPVTTDEPLRPSVAEAASAVSAMVQEVNRVAAPAPSGTSAPSAPSATGVAPTK